MRFGPKDGLVLKPKSVLPNDGVESVYKPDSGLPTPQIFMDRVQIIEKLVDRPVEVIREVEKIVERVVEVRVEVPVEVLKIQEVEKRVEVPVEVTKEVDVIHVEYRVPHWARWFILASVVEAVVLAIMLGIR